MGSFKNLLKFEKHYEYLLGAIFLIYIIFQVQTPHSLALLINNFFGNAVIIFLALSLFMAVHPVIAILGLVVAIELIRRSKSNLGTSLLASQPPPQDRRTFDMMAQNQFPITLEEEVVKNRAPLIHEGSMNSPSTYKPVLEDDNNATLLHSM